MRRLELPSTAAGTLALLGTGEALGTGTSGGAMLGVQTPAAGAVAPTAGPLAPLTPDVAGAEAPTTCGAAGEAEVLARLSS